MFATGSPVRGGTHRDLHPGQGRWTLGFEATAPEDALRSVLHATAALVFAQAMPGSAEPGPDESRSYLEWLCQRPRAERYVDA